MKLKYRYPLAQLREVRRNAGATAFMDDVNHNLTALTALIEAEDELKQVAACQKSN